MLLAGKEYDLDIGIFTGEQLQRRTLFDQNGRTEGNRYPNREKGSLPSDGVNAEIHRCVVRVSKVPRTRLNVCHLHHSGSERDRKSAPST